MDRQSREGSFHGEGAFHVAMEGAVVRVGSGFGRGGEGAGPGLNDGIERGTGVRGDGVRFDVFVGDTYSRSGADRFRTLVFEALDQYLCAGRCG